MIWTLFSPTIVATVLLIPRPGVDLQKIQHIQENVQKKEDDDGALGVVLRKAKPAKIAKTKKKKKKKKSKVVSPVQDSTISQEEENLESENLDKEYKDELKFLNSRKPKTLKPGHTTANELRVPNSVAPENKDLLAEVEKKYINNFVQMKVDKEVTQAILEKTKSYSGDIAIGPKGLFKMDISTPEKSSLIMDGKNIWVVDYPVDEAQNKVQILHSKARKKLKKQAFLGSLLSDGKLLKNFKVDDQTSSKDETKFKLIPKEKDLEIQRIELSVDSHDKLITGLTYWDQLGNKTELKFSKQEFKPEVPKDFFKFEPPKDSSISEL